MRADIQAQQLRDAVDAGELVLYFQPKVSLLSGEIIGAEALVRWRIAGGQVIPPDDFIPLAEEIGILPAITVDMLEQCVQAIQILKRQFSGLSVSMNVTPHDLETHSVSRQIERDLERGRLQQGDLQIEITESIAMGDFERIYNDLIDLNRMGVPVLMDDFGTGYSSIDRLSRLPFSSLKLDKGVVQRMGSSRQNLDVVKSSISMARELRMISVAEGVENEGAYNFLLANGCEEAQGYWISHPLELQEFIDFVARAPKLEGSQLGRVHQALFNILHYRKSLIDAAYCYRLNADTILDSVVDPEVELSAQESRFGQWYYGIGQRLEGISGFAELEQPFLSLHTCGQNFMQALQSGADAMKLHAVIAQTDAHMSDLTAALSGLERELLLAAVQRPEPPTDQE